MNTNKKEERKTIALNLLQLPTAATGLKTNDEKDNPRDYDTLKNENAELYIKIKQFMAYIEYLLSQINKLNTKSKQTANTMT